MTDITVEEMEPGSPRYPEPVSCRKARMKRLDPAQSIALDELMERYRKADNEKPVAITARQLATARNMSRMTAYRALEALISEGFVVVIAKGSYEAKRLPSRYRLTMFPCNGMEPTNDYVEDVKEWRRAGRRKPRKDAPLPPTVDLLVRNVPTSHLVDVQEAIEATLPIVPSDEAA
jgi:hypothetical protein